MMAFRTAGLACGMPPPGAPAAMGILPPPADGIGIPWPPGAMGAEPPVGAPPLCMARCIMRFLMASSIPAISSHLSLLEIDVLDLGPYLYALPPLWS